MPAKKSKSKKAKTAKKNAPRKSQEPAASIEKGFKDFEEEIEGLAKRWEKSGGVWDKKVTKWWYSRFGPLGPLLLSLLGLVCIVIAIWVLDWINQALNIVFIYNFSLFLESQIAVLFGLILFFKYAGYAKVMAPRAYYIAKPGILTVKMMASLWFIAWVLRLVYWSVGNIALDDIAVWVFSNMWTLFFVLVIISYGIAILVRSEEVKRCKKE